MDSKGECGLAGEESLMSWEKQRDAAHGKGLSDKSRYRVLMQSKTSSQRITKQYYLCVSDLANWSRNLYLLRLQVILTVRSYEVETSRRESRKLFVRSGSAFGEVRRKA